MSRRSLALPPFAICAAACPTSVMVEERVANCGEMPADTPKQLKACLPGLHFCSQECVQMAAGSGQQGVSLAAEASLLHCRRRRRRRRRPAASCARVAPAACLPEPVGAARRSANRCPCSSNRQHADDCIALPIGIGFCAHGWLACSHRGGRCSLPRLASSHTTPLPALQWLVRPPSIYCSVASGAPIADPPTLPPLRRRAPERPGSWSLMGFACSAACGMTEGRPINGSSDSRPRPWLPNVEVPRPLCMKP